MLCWLFLPSCDQNIWYRYLKTDLFWLQFKRVPSVIAEKAGWNSAILGGTGVNRNYLHHSRLGNSFVKSVSLMTYFCHLSHTPSGLHSSLPYFHRRETKALNVGLWGTFEIQTISDSECSEFSLVELSEEDSLVMCHLCVKKGIVT